MCGIAGKIQLSGKKVTEKEILLMTGAIEHRGPDDSGTFISPDKKVGLGQRRLSIIDLSPLGHQPMPYANRYWIVFNGEIYNFQEKRELLLKAGYKFKSQSDTEVIMALYDKFGVECLSHLRGMFAFAIYDEKEETLFCARDRVGKKPFKYYFDGHSFYFASELKAILTQPEIPREPDHQAIHHYLTLQYTPAPQTGFKNIQKLEAAHYLFLDLKTKHLRKERYWKLNYAQKLKLTRPEWKDRILAKLEESVRLRMIADVPLGAFLSGGIDSSAVVAMMAKHSSQPVKTFSIGFGDPKFNELPYARQIAERFGTDHHEFMVEPDAISVLPLLVEHYEEPYADSSALPSYYVSKLTRDHVTVALNGDGGDENFAGYSRYSVQEIGLLTEKLGPLNDLISLPLAKLMHKIKPGTLTERMERFAKSMQTDYKRRFISYTSFFTNEQKAALYTPEFAQEQAGIDTYDLIAGFFNEATTPDRNDQTLYADFASYLPEDLLAKVDIASMMVALEGRSPFLDHEMLELTAQIPFNLKIAHFTDKKSLLKYSLEDILPHEIMYRRKMGFSIPLGKWFQTDLKDYAHDILLSDQFINRGLFERNQIEQILKDHAEGKANYPHHIWALLTLALWFEKYFV